MVYYFLLIGAIMNVEDCIRNSLKYAEKGWKVFPVAPNRRKPAFKGWQDEATTDRGKIIQWWKTEFKDANVGIATGPRSKNLVVLDVDMKNGKDGIKSLMDISGGEWPETYTVKTPNDGYHFYFISEEPYSNFTNIRPGLDLRGDGGLIVAPPSTIDGKEYTLESDIDTPVAPIPVWLAEALSTPKGVRAIPALPPPAPIEAGSRNNTMFKQACGIRDQGIPKEQALTRMLDVNQTTCVEPLETKEVENLLEND